MVSTTTIRVDKEVLRELERRIGSFSDTPNAVLRRVLGLESPGSGEPEGIPVQHFRRGRKPGSRIGRTQEREFRRPILESLDEMGGEATVQDILDSVGRKMAGVLTPIDHEAVTTGEARWRSTAKFERQRMLADGLLEPSVRGFWRISGRGRDWLRQPFEPAEVEAERPGPQAFGIKRPERLDIAKARRLMDQFVEDNIEWLKDMAKR